MKKIIIKKEISVPNDVFRVDNGSGWLTLARRLKGEDSHIIEVLTIGADRVNEGFDFDSEDWVAYSIDEIKNIVRTFKIKL